MLYEFERFRLNPAEHSLQCGGKTVPLTPKSFEILLALIECNGRLVTKDELMTKIWPDSFVEEANLTVNVSALRKALGDTTEHQQYIETVPKLGYRFIAPVTELPVAKAPTTARPKTEPPVTELKNGNLAPAARLAGEGPRLASEEAAATRHSATVVAPGRPFLGSRMAAATVFAGLIAIAALGYWFFRKHAPATQGKAEPCRLAILPFRNLKQDTISDFLGYSLADAVITKLGSVQSLRVRPSYAIEKYRDRTVDLYQVASELDVDTLLTGNFIRDGDDLRITCQLIDVKARSIRWKGSFDVRYQKLLTVQDQVAERIIHGLELNLSSSEQARLKLDEPADPLAYEYYLRGVDLYSRSDFPLAVRMFEKSSDIDPNYALTWAYLGRSYNASGSFQLEGPEYYRKAQAAFDRALALQPAQIETRVYLTNFLTDTGKVEQAIPLLRESLKSNPHHAELHWELGYAYRFAGMLKESVAECEEARKLDPGVKLNNSELNTYLYLGEYDRFLQSLPKNTDMPFHLFYRGLGEFYEKHFEQAAADFDRAFELNPGLLQAQVGKALSDALNHQEPKGLEILRAAESKIQARGAGDSEGVYKLAQAYAVLGDRAAALRMLKHSIDYGFFPHPYFTTDPLLNSLRGEAQFAALLEIARQRHQSFRTSFF